MAAFTAPRAALQETSAVTFLFTDIEGSTRLWEQEPERMRPALARHDALVREAVQRNRGHVVKMTGDGVHAAFEDPLDAVRTTLELQQALSDPSTTGGLALPVRCGMHAGANERRDGDYYGSVVNRAARIMAVAHGGQMLLSQAVAERLGGRLPDGVLLRDLGAVRLRDLAQAERLYQLVHPALRSDFPALRSLEGTPNNLPSAFTSFVGRERELAEARRLLQHNRLVSLVGMGGLGKSRLAYHIAASVLDDFQDGVWLAELAPVTDPRRVPQAIATVLGVKEEPGAAVEETLLRYVKNREMLLLLDNCEHLVGDVAALARRLLSSAASLRLLVTTREPLRMSGETILNVPPLLVPGPRHAAEGVSLEQFDAVRLLLDRARLVVPDFELTRENGPDIAAISHRLDGIPLAIELAAARLRSMPVHTLAARLNDRYRLLLNGDRTASPRQRTLRALIDWSYDLLEEDERILFRRLAIFAGSWTVAAAEEVCGGDGVELESVLDILSRLVEKSLVAVDHDAQRYRMLETVREYALARLDECGERDRVGGRHLAHVVALVMAAKQQLGGPQHAQWLARIDAEHENILHAHARAGASPAYALQGLSLVEALAPYWAQRGLLELGHRLTEEALAREALAGEPGLCARVLFNLGQFRYYMGHAGARRTLEECLARARANNDSALLARILQTLGMAAVGQGDLGAARGWLQEAVERAEASGDKRWLAGAVNSLAMLRRVEGEYAQALPLYRQVVALAHETGGREAESMGLLNLSMMCVENGDTAAGMRYLAQAIAIAVEIGSALGAQSGLEVCAGIAAARADHRRAARFFGAAEASAARTGARRDAADERFLAPRIELARGQLGESAFDEACAEGRSLPPERALEEARSWLAAGAAVATA